MSGEQQQKGQPIPINALPVEKLREISANVESRCENLADAIAQLNGALSRYDEIRESLNYVEGSDGREILVPLTDSLYAPGRMEDRTKVIVDIGTGFFAEKTVADAKSFVERKRDFVRKQIAELEEQLDTQSRNLEQITLVLSAKTGGRV